LTSHNDYTGEKPEEPDYFPEDFPSGAGAPLPILPCQRSLCIG